MADAPIYINFFGQAGVGKTTLSRILRDELTALGYSVGFAPEFGSSNCTTTWFHPSDFVITNQQEPKVGQPDGINILLQHSQHSRGHAQVDAETRIAQHLTGRCNFYYVAYPSDVAFVPTILGEVMAHMTPA
jgi:GTPase SAR1 family protein